MVPQTTIFLPCLEIRTGVVFPAKERRFLVIVRNPLCEFATKPPVSAAGHRALRFKITTVSAILFHFGHPLQIISFLKIANMGQRHSLLFAPFPADMLVWKPLLRILLSPSEDAEGKDNHLSTSPGQHLTDKPSAINYYLRRLKPQNVDGFNPKKTCYFYEITASALL